MPAGLFDFVGDDRWEQGSTLTRPLGWAPDGVDFSDFTGWAARMQVRASVTSTTVLLELTTENGGISLDLMPGFITLTMTDEEASTKLTWRRGLYQLELIPPGGEAFRFLEGEIEVSPELTR